MVTIYVLLYFTLGYSAVISSVVMVVIFPVQYFMSERLGKAHERALVSSFCPSIVSLGSTKRLSDPPNFDVRDMFWRRPSLPQAEPFEVPWRPV